jgi:hypothetical protein
MHSQSAPPPTHLLKEDSMRMKWRVGFQSVAALIGLLLSFSAVCGDIAYIDGKDEGTAKFNHAATKVFTNGTDLAQAISIGNEELGRAEDKGRVFVLRQLIATLYTFAGRYDKAVEIYPVISRAATITALAKEQRMPRFVDAATAIAAMAKDRRAVFINENHGSPITRLLPLELLPKLRAQGFQYLALETLNRGEASNAYGCVDLVDRDLCQRGYALDNVRTGIYSHDPVYGVLIRRALSLGFRLVAYDVFDAVDDQARDAGEARNLANVYKNDPSAKMMVVAGEDHVAKVDANMAAVFKRITQIDPLSIDQTALLGLDPLLWGPHADVPRDRASVVFMGNGALSTRPGAMDVSVYRPAFFSDRERAGWLTLGGLRVPMPIPHACHTYPCLLTARRNGEPASVPEDRLYLDKPGKALLYLAPGRYALSAQISGGTSTKSILVPPH